MKPAASFVFVTHPPRGSGSDVGEGCGVDPSSVHAPASNPREAITTMAHATRRTSEGPGPGGERFPAVVRKLEVGRDAPPECQRSLEPSLLDG